MLSRSKASKIIECVALEWKEVSIEAVDILGMIWQPSSKGKTQQATAGSRSRESRCANVTRRKQMTVVARAKAVARQQHK